uniref:ATP synthase F0 subunit 8 n=1 Tax=Pheidole obscurithorax TaxID=458959 RepID=A0A2U8XDV5_9HYME|nr:ATP synthase F0 subunit 8 [Pheidole obscurithorax]
MPQMMPLWWVIMLVMTVGMLLLIIILMYFMNLPKLTPLMKNTSLFFTNWNWSW